VVKTGLKVPKQEPHGIVECAKDIWNYCKAWFKVFIGDDDSTSCAALHHSIPDKIQNGSLTQYPIGKDKHPPKSSGKLPPDIHELEIFLVDPFVSV